MAEIRKIPIGLIHHRPDARIRTDAALAALEESIAANGLLQPILVRPVSYGEFEVAAGSHRLNAIELLEWPEVDCIVVELGDLRAEAAMIDENLVRTELSPSGRAKATARAKELYLALHPETRNGGDRLSSGVGAVRQLGDVEIVNHFNVGGAASVPSLAPSYDDVTTGTARFTSDLAARTGTSERSIQRDAERGEKIAPEVLDTIAGTKLDTGRGLDEVKKVPKPEQAAYVERRLAEPKASTQQPPQLQGGVAGRYQSAPEPVDFDSLEKRFTAGGEWFLKADLSGLLKFLEGKGPRRAQALRLMSSLAEHLDAVREGASR